MGNFDERQWGISVSAVKLADQITNRKRRGARGGRPPAFDAADYKGRNVVERTSTTSSNGAAWPLATTNSLSSTGPQRYYVPSHSGCPIYQTRLSGIRLVVQLICPRRFEP